MLEPVGWRGLTPASPRAPHVEHERCHQLRSQRRYTSDRGGPAMFDVYLCTRRELLLLPKGSPIPFTGKEMGEAEENSAQGQRREQFDVQNRGYYLRQISGWAEIRGSQKLLVFHAGASVATVRSKVSGATPGFVRRRKPFRESSRLRCSGGGE